jgi:hypothetical protein
MSSKKSGYARIQEKLAQAEALMKECEAIADAEGLSFRISGPTYGMGGTYHPTKPKKDPKEVDEDGWEESDDEDSGWQASSTSC